MRHPDIVDICEEHNILLEVGAIIQLLIDTIPDVPS